VRTAAAPPFAAVLARMPATDPGTSFGLLVCPLDELYAEPSRRFIESHGGDVAGAPAKIHLRGGHVDYVEARGMRLVAGAIVVAVPWYALSDLFAGDTAPVEGLRKAASATQPSPIASVNLWLDRRVLQTPFLGLPGRVMQWVFDKEQMFESDTSHLTLVSSGADEVMTFQNEDLIALALRELREALPDSRAAKVLRASVVRERRATFSLAPGQPKRPETATEVPRLVLAGDWIETGLPATIEGAAASGRLAADSLS
jgi:predicted NAD/FAD-dependent oxidoreductase